MSVAGDDAVVENTRSGIIESKDAESAAVELNVVEIFGPAAGTSSQLVNSGKVVAPDIAVLGGAGQETAINRGRIVGDVSLGDGDDTFTFARGGTVDGEVFAGSGNDVIHVENGSGNNRVADFTAGDTNDAVDVSAFFSSFDQVRATLDRLAMT